jgi:hypothetical protein
MMKYKEEHRTAGQRINSMLYGLCQEDLNRSSIISGKRWYVLRHPGATRLSFACHRSKKEGHYHADSMVEHHRWLRLCVV